MKKLLILALALILISLAGCGTTTPTAGGGVTLPAYYVNAATGLDTNAGTQAAPFKTITKALATASTGISLNIFVAPGTYDTANGEVFPLKIASSGVNLIGDAANKGVGAASTTITGGVGYTAIGGSPAVGFSTTLIFAPGVSASISGFDITGAQNPITIDSASVATISNNTVTGTRYVIAITSNSTATLTSNIISGFIGIDAEGPLTTVTARGNIINQNAGSWGVVTSNYNAAGANLDLGTPASPGNNTILGSVVGFSSWATSGSAMVQATGNTWKPNVQGADALGHYPTPFIASTAAVAGGNNYATDPTTTGIQFYTQGGGAIPHTGIQ